MVNKKCMRIYTVTVIISQMQYFVYTEGENRQADLLDMVVWFNYRFNRS